MFNRLMENLAFKITALLIGIGIWFYVVQAQNPAVESVFTVPLEVVLDTGELVVAQKPTSVAVRIRGLRGRVEDLHSVEILAQARIDTPRLGINRTTVEAAVPPGLQVVGVEPNLVEVRLDRVSQVRLPIETKVRGQVAEGFASLQPVIVPQEVLASGPQELLDSINRLEAEIDLAYTARSLRRVVPVVAVDRWSQPIKAGIILQPEIVEVTVPVMPAGGSQWLPVKVDLRGKPADGWQVARVQVVPEQLLIYGNSLSRSELDYLVTAPVDVAGRNTSLVMEQQILLPWGLETALIPMVTVFVEIKPAAEAKE